MRKRTVLSMIVAAVMALTVFACNTDQADAAANKSLYWLKVNRYANVVTAYKLKNGKYVPYRAMVCSTGAPESKTPLMTGKVGIKMRWGYLYGDVWGQYCTQFKGDFLFHSVYYKSRNKKNTLVGKEYNKLGTSCSMGCVRLSVMDAKWIYENCSRGTKVTVYSSKYPGPLGKPKPQKVSSKYGWDPTDPDKNNPIYRIKKPVITISAKKSNYVQYGNTYTLKKYVTARNVNAYQELTPYIKVSSVKKWNGKSWVKTTFSTKRLGTYRITYKVYSKYCGGTSYKSFRVKVVDTLAPALTVPKSREVSVGDANAVSGVSAKQKTRDRTAYIKVSITAPDKSVSKQLNYSEAKKYVFSMPGEYKITYSVKNYYSPYRQTIKTLKVKCKGEIIQPVEPSEPTDPSEPAEPTDSIEATEPADPFEPDEPEEPMQSSQQI